MNIAQTKKFLHHAPIDIAVLIMGNHGIGKSAVVKQVAQEQYIPCIDFRLAQNDVGDLKGIPYMVNGRTVFAPPEFFPMKEADAIELKDLLNLSDNISLGKYGDRGILFLDEINRANREVQQAAFELVLDRRLNLRSLPDGWRVVAAINGNDDIYSVNSMEPAFLSRFALVELVPLVKEWIYWAEDAKVHESITQFIWKNSDFLDPSEEMLKKASLNGVEKVFDRRAWEMFSRTLLKYEKDFKDNLLPFHPLDKTEEAYEELIGLASSFVGNSAAMKFQEFIDSDYGTLSADIILNHFDQTVANKVKDLIDRRKYPELSSYNDMIVSFIENTIQKNLSITQKKNLTRYIVYLPFEIRAHFWDLFSNKLRSISNDWYMYDIKTTKVNANLITEAITNPEIKNKVL